MLNRTEAKYEFEFIPPFITCKVELEGIAWICSQHGIFLLLYLKSRCWDLQVGRSETIDSFDHIQAPRLKGERDYILSQPRDKVRNSSGWTMIFNIPTPSIGSQALVEIVCSS